MKKIIFLCFCFSLLIAKDTLIQKEQYDVLAKDMRNIKATFISTDKDIQSLNKKFDYVISKLQKQIVANSVASNEIQRLHSIIQSLEEKIAQLENKEGQNKVLVTTKKPLQATLNQPLVIKNDDKKIESFKLYDPQPKSVIVDENSLDKIDKIQVSHFSIQVGIFRQQKSLDNAKKMYEKIINKKTNRIVFEHCSSCKNSDLTKVLIDGFNSKPEAQSFVKAHKLKNSRIIDNRG